MSATQIVPMSGCPCEMGLYLGAVAFGAKATYDTISGSQTKDVKTSQRVALGAAATHCLMKVVKADMGLLPELICAVAYIAALYMGYKICETHNHLATEVQKTTTLAVMLFAMCFQSQLAIAYVVPVLVAGYRANSYEYATEDVKTVEEVAKPEVEEKEVVEEKPEPVMVEEIEPTVDTEPIESGSEESGNESQGSRGSSFEEEMLRKLGAFRKASPNADKVLSTAQDDFRRQEIMKDKRRDQAFSGEYNDTNDTNNHTRQRNVEDSLKEHARQKAAHEAFQNKMDAAHQATAPEPIQAYAERIPTPVGPVRLQRGSVNADMKLKMDWKATGTSTSLKPKKTMESGGFGSGLDKLRAMKKLKKMGKELKRLARNSGTPQMEKPALAPVDAIPATHSKLPIQTSTEAIGGVLDAKKMLPSLNRAVATPDQDALKNPETAKISDGLITIRAKVLYESMGAMLKETNEENQMLRAQVECCKTIISRLRNQITTYKRETAITKVMAFMDQHALETERNLQEQKLAGVETPVEEPAIESLQGKWTVLHYDGDIDLSLDQEEDGMITGDAGDFLENVSGKYDPTTRGLCMRVDNGPGVFQLVQGEMLSGFAIVMLRNFNNGVELPCEFCIMAKDDDQSQVVTQDELDASDEEYQYIETADQQAPTTGTMPAQDINVQTT